MRPLIPADVFVQAFRSNPAAIAITRLKDGVLLEINEACKSIFGATQDELIGRSTLGLNLLAAPESGICLVDELRKDGRLRNREVTVRRLSGEPFTALLSADLQTIGGEELVISTWLDITGRKQAEDALRESEQNYREIFDNVSDAIFVHDATTGSVLDVNSSMLQMFGLDRETAQMLKPNDTSLGVSPYSELEATQWLVKSLTEGPQVFEWRARRTDGKIFWTEVSLKRAVISGQQRVLALVRDITERKQAEEALFESEEKFRLAFGASPDAININRMEDGLYVDINEGFTRLTGFTRDDVIGKTSLELNIWHDPADRLKLVQGLRDKGSYDNLEAVFGRKDGCLLTALMSARIILLKGVEHILTITRDISERKQAEEEHAKLEAQLQQAQKMESVGRLAGGVAHDFNNMLCVVLGHVDLTLEQVDPNQPLYDDLLEIRNAAQRSTDLTRQLLAFARKQTIAPRTLDLNGIISGMTKMLQRLIGESILLNWQPAAMLWPVLVDPSQIDQILANLCINARDAITDVGRITIETGNCILDREYCAAHAGFVPGEYVQLTVSDNGCGMDKETLSHIFEPFFTTKGVGAGTGLGLATVYGAVQQNNGFINVESKPGLGTTITIYLPHHKDKAVKSPVEDAVPPRRGQETILLVEDEPSILKLATTILKRQGYTVLAAGSPGEAIHLAREHAGGIHLLLTDVIMPDMNGRTLARQLRSLYPNLKCLFMSGYTSDVIANHGVLEAGVVFVQKPFSAQSLAKSVLEALATEKPA